MATHGDVPSAGLDYVTLVVDDVESPAAFYDDHLGLRRVEDGDAFVLLAGDGGASVGLHAGEPLAHPERVQLHFPVPSVDDAHERLSEAGLRFESGPSETPWGYRVAELRDPAGHTVELFESVDS